MEGTDLPKDTKFKVIEELGKFNYVLDSPNPIAKGDFGFVYKAKSTIMNLCDCKVIVIANQPNLMGAIEEEVEALKIIPDQARIAPIYFSKATIEFVMHGMEYCPNESLERCVKSRNGQTMEESAIKSFAHQISSAKYCYTEKKTVHRDIKPANILIDEYNKLKMADLGLAREINGKSKLSTTVGIDETERYLSPELKDGEEQSEKSDVWAFGVVLLELAYGSDAYKTSKIIRMDCEKVRKQFTERGGYSKEMSSFMVRCFEEESGVRATVEELLQDKWLEGISEASVVEESKLLISVGAKEPLRSSKINYHYN